MKDVDDFVRKQGIIEEYLLSEAGTTGKYGERWKNFVEDAIKKISANPDMDDKSLRQLAKEYKISDALFDKAGWFMRVPERYNRKVAYIAHYLQAQELFGNVLPEYDANGEYKGHPYLHHLAKKGVENTQYFYSASYRPAFSRTAFGKVLTRFQLYPMNTLKYRKNLYDEAKMHGLNSEQGERFSRFIIMDTISLALSAAFAYTLFDYALPSPYTYFQDIANFMFGDEEEKRKAFFGGYPYPLNPLQIITPPALRMFPGLVTGMISNDWRGVVGYQAWAMFPFGRMARDINKTYKDPNKAVDYMLGLPLSRLRNDSEREKEKVANKQKTAYTISGIL
jgi:hypothetical protein